MTNNHNPLAQFELHKIWNLKLFNMIDISITNSSLFMFAAMLAASCYCLIALPTKNGAIPSRLQASVEYIYQMIHSTLDQSVGKNKGQKFIPLIFSSFVFILLCNLFGMLPYAFTVTSHISITFTMAFLMFTIITLTGIIKHGWHFLSLFLPKGIPLWLAPLMILIELFTYLSRPISLSLRLAANMMAGHILLKVIAGFAVSLGIFFKVIPIPFLAILIGIEVFIAILQAYIFTVLSCTYLNDAINLH